MRPPFTIVLLLPLLILCIALFNNQEVIVFILATFLVLLIEIRLRKGDLSWKSIASFFNTPIKQEGLLGEELVDSSPKVSIFAGVGIILGGAVLITAIIFIGFASLAK